MADVTQEWIRKYVQKLSGFGGLIDKEFVLENRRFSRGGFETTLTQIGKEAVEMRQRPKKFHILLPDGLGWADVWGYCEVNEDGQ